MKILFSIKTIENLYLICTHYIYIHSVHKLKLSLRLLFFKLLQLRKKINLGIQFR